MNRRKPRGEAERIERWWSFVTPRILFVTTNTGEHRATLANGTPVWTVAASWRQHDPDERTVRAVADALGLSTAEIELALGYWAEYPDEIDDLIERHHASQDVALRAWERPPDGASG